MRDVSNVSTSYQHIFEKQKNTPCYSGITNQQLDDIIIQFQLPLPHKLQHKEMKNTASHHNTAYTIAQEKHHQRRTKWIGGNSKESEKMSITIFESVTVLPWKSGEFSLFLSSYTAQHIACIGSFFLSLVRWLIGWLVASFITAFNTEER